MTLLPSSVPHSWGVQVQQWVLTTPAELRELRAALLAALAGSADPAAEMDDVPAKMLLVATELATNALRHGLPPTVVVLFRRGDEFILDVADQDPTILPEYAAARPPGAGGLGLRLAREFSLDIGWYVDDTTKHVWAKFPARGDTKIQ
ncbi:MAG TPA: ATP-binding protein [Actinoplanes sp.]|nr:ATP-binding protein [Actinoplanes sp.]